MFFQDILRRFRNRRLRQGFWFTTLLCFLIIWKIRRDEDSIRIKAKNAELCDYILQNHLIPPALIEMPYNLNNSRSVYLAHDEVHAALLKTLKKYSIDTGFFIEAGALDGEYLSHTLELEMYRGWTGLLVEASPSLLPQLRSKMRKSWIAGVCLTTADNVTVEFVTKSNQKEAWMRGNGRIDPNEVAVNATSTRFKPELHKSEGKVYCYKLGTILSAINVTQVDLLVLDVEGHEYKILEAHDFYTIPIKIIAVETWVMAEPFEMLTSLMDKNGYELEFRSNTDAIFVLK